MERARWSQDEDHKLSEYIKRNGEPRSWKYVPGDAGLSRTPKSCKLRWNDNLKDDINKNPLSEEEKATIIQLQKDYGKKWETIAQKMSGRTATMIKNFWNSPQGKKLSKKDPQVCPRNPDGIGFGPAPVSASLEPSKADQVVEIVEVTPADQELVMENEYSDSFWRELLMDNETSDRFCGDISLGLHHSDGSYNIIN